MKHTISILFCLLLTSASMKAQTLNLSLKGLPDGAKMYIELAGTYDSHQKPIQTVTLKDGKAKFTIGGTEPRGYYLMMEDAHLMQLVVLSPKETATFSASFFTIDSWDEKFNYVTLDKQVTGSPTNDYYLAHKADRDSLDVLHTKYYEDAQPILTELNKYKRGTVEYDSICKTSAYLKFAAAEKRFFELADSVLIAPVYANKDTWWGPFFLTNEMSYITPKQKPIYEAFSEAAKNSFYGRIVQSFVCPPYMEGKVMPDFSFTNHATGQKMSLYSICKKNQYVLVDFWASWCGPCRREIPNFKSQYELYHDKGFDVISISADAKEADWLEALEQEKLAWPNDRDGEQGICALYKVAAYPTIYLLDSEGKVVAHDEECRGEQLKALLSKLFK